MLGEPQTNRTIHCAVAPRAQRIACGLCNSLVRKFQIHKEFSAFKPRGCQELSVLEHTQESVEFLMSGSLKQTAPFMVRLLPEHPKHERLPKPRLLSRGGRIVLLMFSILDGTQGLTSLMARAPPQTAAFKPRRAHRAFDKKLAIFTEAFKRTKILSVGVLQV